MSMVELQDILSEYGEEFKAKRRMLEIVLGLVLFGCMYGLLKWLGVGSS